MPKYHYLARNKLGEMISRNVEAPNESVLIEQLLKDNYILLELSPVEKKGDIALSRFSFGFGLKKPTLVDLSILSRQLYAMTKTGVSIVQALLLVSECSQNESLTMALKKVMKMVEGGQSLANSLSTFPDIFPSMMVALVNVGENTGRLDQVFAQLSHYFERELETNRRLKEATRYPILVVGVILIALIVINIFVIPAFQTLFKQFHAGLPWQTRVLIATSDFLLKYWMALLAAGMGLMILIKRYIRTDSGHMFWDRWKLNIPFIGPILKKALLARFVHAFSLSMRTGLPVLEAISLIAKTTDNAYVGHKILSMRKNIEHGESLTSAARTSGMFTPLVLQMLSVGEQSGDLETLMEEVGRYYDEEIDYELKKLGTAIEPVLIGFIAGIVLVLALGVFLPMWNLSEVMIKGS